MFSEANALGLFMIGSQEHRLGNINVRLAMDCSMSVASSIGYLSYVPYNNGVQLQGVESCLLYLLKREYADHCFPQGQLDNG